MPHQMKERMMPEWMVESSQLSDVGQKRRHNEDYVGFYEPGQIADLETRGRLYVLADGVGGAAAGEIASQYTVKKIIHCYYQSSDDDVAPQLRRAIEDANADIFAQNLSRTDRREMATTVVAAVIQGNQLTVANVGDSRAYIVRGENIEQITEDHSLVAELISDGSITAEQAETHPYRNVILRSVGAHETVQVDIFSRQIAPGDLLILCSDGLLRHVTDQELADIARAYSPSEAAQRLVSLANERGGDDNITISITHISNSPVQSKVTGAGQLPEMPRWEDLQHP
ncbi:MAG: Stp1/IreP family PP2C-type Ser/Thr phosphatase [Anaerolineae bacterium]|jgi:serine/threonine protein phosphatase PrpC